MNTPFQLHGKRILILGATSGIGCACAINAAKLGAELILTGRNSDKLSELEISLTGNGHSKILADLTVESDIDEIIKSSNKLSGIVFCPAVTSTKPFKFIQVREVEEMFSVNFLSSFSIMKNLIKQKRFNDKASVVFISSIAGNIISSYGNGIYGASKSALNALAKNMALELAPKIRVNTVMPGMIDTGFLKNSGISEKDLEIDKKKYPLKRYGKPNEVAYAVIYLLSEASSWITGTNLKIDGGYTII